jgi:hypothetical protein
MFNNPMSFIIFAFFLATPKQVSVIGKHYLLWVFFFQFDARQDRGFGQIKLYMEMVHSGVSHFR